MNWLDITDGHHGLSHEPDTDEAAQKLAEASQKFPELPALHRAKGDVALQTGRYEEARDEDAPPGEEGGPLPPLEAGELVDLVRLLPEQHFTQPPPRFTEARLVKTLEELGIGRPSTYAPTLETIQKRNNNNIERAKECSLKFWECQECK